MNKQIVTTIIALTGFVLLFFQNCSEVEFETLERTNLKAGDNCVINPDECDMDLPYVDKAGVVTILLALGDQFNNSLVIEQESSKLLAEDLVKYASPVKEPKILVVRDRLHNNESIEDLVHRFSEGSS